MPPSPAYNQSSASPSRYRRDRDHARDAAAESSAFDWSATEHRGVLERIVWPKPDAEPSRDGMVIARLRDGSSVKGSLFAPALGQEYIFSPGRWEEGKPGRDGRPFPPTFVFKDALALQPTTTSGARDYLVAHGDWVGPATAKAIVEAFGADGALETCKSDPALVARTIRGITMEKANALAVALTARASIEAVEVAVRGIVGAVPAPGVTKRQLGAILTTYGGEAVAVLRGNPYRLIEEIDGIGWKTADAIGRAVGVATEDPARIRAGIFTAIVAKEDEGGHTCVERGALVVDAVGLLLVAHEKVEASIADLVAKGELVVEEGDGRNAPAIFRAQMHAAEAAISAAFVRLLSPERVVPRRPVEPRAPTLADADALALEYDAYAGSADASTARTASSIATPHASVVAPSAAHTKTRKAATPLEAWAADAVRALAAMDTDHAAERNGAGFSKSDGPRGHRWAKAVEATGELLEREWEAVVRLAAKYRRQVGAAPSATGTQEMSDVRAE